MEVLNRNERLKAFWLFFVCFSITILVVILGVFFYFQVPREENKYLRNENFLLRREFEFQQEFALHIDSVKGYIDLINAPGQDNFFQEQLALKELAEMY